jgi:short-subunit dehydrogenase
MKLTTSLTMAALAAAGLNLTKGRRPDDLSGEVAVVTGASRGLGLLLARELARHCCRLVLCARDSAELTAAAAELRDSGASVTEVACDLTDEAAPQLLVQASLEAYGRLDILINNAGTISVGPVESTRPEDYDAALQLMTLAPIRTTLAALPVMRRQAHGRIVNITSIGGKISAPHLLPYNVAKFAVVGFSEGLRAELGSGPVAVTTVVPGLMRTGSHLRAYFSGRQEAEFTWFSLGASLPLVSMDGEAAARQIVSAIRFRRSELILTPLAQLAARLAPVAPELTSAVLRQVARLLPAPDGRRHELAAGLELKPALNQQVFDWLTALGRRAAQENNQLPQPAMAGPPAA